MWRFAPALEGELHPHIHGPFADTNAGIADTISPAFHGRIVALGRLRIGNDLNSRLGLWLRYRLKVGIRREGLNPQTPPAASAHSQEQWKQDCCDRQAPQR
jgi:hypothetical protein